MRCSPEITQGISYTQFRGADDKLKVLFQFRSGNTDSQILIVQAYRYGDASLVAPFEYSTMLWAVAIGWFWFGEWPTLAILIGATIVIVSGIYVILRERQLGLARREQREVGPSRMT